MTIRSQDDDDLEAMYGAELKLTVDPEDSDDLIRIADSFNDIGYAIKQLHSRCSDMTKAPLTDKAMCQALEEILSDFGQACDDFEELLEDIGIELPDDTQYADDSASTTEAVSKLETGVK